MKLSMTLWCNEKKIRTLWELEWTIQVCVDMTPMKRHQERTDCFCLSEKDYKTKQSEIHQSTVDYTQVENKKTVENLHQSGHASKLTQRSNHKMLREIAKKNPKCWQTQLPHPVVPHSGAGVLIWTCFSATGPVHHICNELTLTSHYSRA